MSGGPLAMSVCDQAAAALCVGIRLVATRFQQATVEVALIGGAARSDYVQRDVDGLLRADRVSSCMRTISLRICRT